MAIRLRLRVGDESQDCSKEYQLTLIMCRRFSRLPRLLPYVVAVYSNLFALPLPYSTRFFSPSVSRMLSVRDCKEETGRIGQGDYLCHLPGTLTEPKLLPCSHCFCKDCILKLSLRAGAGKPFSCSECREVVVLPKGNVDKLQAAFFINRIQGSIATLEEAHGEVVHQEFAAIAEDSLDKKCPANKQPLIVSALTVVVLSVPTVW